MTLWLQKLQTISTSFSMLLTPALFFAMIGLTWWSGAAVGADFSVPDVYHERGGKLCDDAEQCSFNLPAITPNGKALRIQNVNCGMGSHTADRVVLELVSGGTTLYLVPGPTVQFEITSQYKFHIPLNNNVTFYVKSGLEIRAFFPFEATAVVNCSVTGQLVDSTFP